VGLTGAGKTALGRRLCHSRPDLFTPSNSASSQTPGQVGEQAYPELHLLLRVLDTMGLDDTQRPPEVVRQQTTQGIASLAGGVDFFFLCMKAERFTEPTYVAYKYAHDARHDTTHTNIFILAKGTCSRECWAKGAWATCGWW
jgi:hypothetical protein